MGIWTDRSRTIIHRTLDELPVNATEAACKKILRAAYPFGQRQHAPYRAWCKAVREALARRFAGRSVSGGATPAVRCTLSVRGARLWLDVACDFCADTALSSCMACVRQRWLVQQALEHPDFRQLAALPCEEEGPIQYLILADLVEECLGERPVWVPPDAPKRPKKGVKP